MKSLDVLGVRVDLIDSKKHFRELFMSLLDKKGSKIFTINPEFIVDSYFNPKFRETLNSGNLNSIDGFGVALAVKSKLNREKSKSFFKIFKDYTDGSVRDLVVTGVDIVDESLKIANREKLSLFILGGSSEDLISYRSATMIQKKYPDINLVGHSSEFSYKPKDDIETIKFIEKRMKEKSIKVLDLLLVAYGHQKQEFWIERNSIKIPARVSIGVGGTLDFIAGKVKRAPFIFRSLGLEWLFRLVMQPNRFLRILKATVIYSILSLFFSSKKATKN
jgi:N-acetylglucosaminyldiphosphoundecaprenol N-acetyl-beta-D-mannosaminyltransferase